MEITLGHTYRWHATTEMNRNREPATLQNFSIHVTELVSIYSIHVTEL